MNAYIEHIPGWMGDAELEYLHNMVAEAPEDALIVELGAWKGKSTAALYTAMYGNQSVVTIDSWLGQADLRFDAHREVLDQDVFLEFMNHMEHLGVKPEWYRPDRAGAQYIRALTADALTLFPDHGIKRAFVDADHEAVGTDVDILMPKLASDAILCGHDWNWGNVKEQLESRVTIVEVVGDLWVADI